MHSCYISKNNSQKLHQKNRPYFTHFIDDVEVLDKDFANPLRHMSSEQGRVVDTVWVVVDKAEMLKHMSHSGSNP